MSERCAIHPERVAEITCSRCGAYACFECVGPGLDRVCARCRFRMGGGGRGHVGLVTILGALTLTNGIFIGLFGGMYVAIGGLFPFLPEPRDGSEPPPPLFMFAFMGCFGLVHLVPGLLQIIAGVRIMRFRGRNFALVAVISGVATMLGCYCAPTSILLLVFGVIVLSDEAVRARFDEVAS